MEPSDDMASGPSSPLQSPTTTTPELVLPDDAIPISVPRPPSPGWTSVPDPPVIPSSSPFVPLPSPPFISPPASPLVVVPPSSFPGPIIAPPFSPRPVSPTNPRAGDGQPARKAKRGGGPSSAAKDASVCPTCNGGGRNLVVCIDGTSNQFSKKNTNVVELYSRLVKSNDKQVTFYNSGIGTYARPSWRSLSYLMQVLANKLDLAFALRFDKIILSAYAWLADNYVEGDRIFLFGFSRGAYQVRALSAMIHRVGLIHKGNADQIPFAYELYAVSNEDSEDGIPPQGASQVLNMLSLLLLPIFAFLHRLWNAWERVHEASTAIVDPDAPNSDPASEAHDVRSESVSSEADEDSEDRIPTMQKRFKKAFARDVKVHMVGAWDTVSSVGLVRDKTLPGTTDGMAHVCYFRHALALHERRVKFLPEFVNGGLGPATLRDKVTRVLDTIAEDDDGPLNSVSPIIPVLSHITRAAFEYLSSKPALPASDDDHPEDSEQERPGNTRGISASQVVQKAVTDAAPPHTKEVWFPGSHSDIGGGASPNENMRSFGPALRWMSFEARLAGLKITNEPRRWDTELRRTNSLTPFWKLIEFLPVKRLTYDSVSGTTYRPHLWAKRPFQAGQLVYDSVSAKAKQILCNAGLEIEHDPYLGAENFLRSLEQHVEKRELLSDRELIHLQVLRDGVLGQQQLLDLSQDISQPLATMLSICKERIDEAHSVEQATAIQLVLYGLEYSFDVMRNSRPLHVALDVHPADEMWTFPRPLQRHLAQIRSIGFSHGGARIVSGGWDDIVFVTDVSTGQQVGEPIFGDGYDIDCIAVSHSGRFVVMGSYGVSTLPNAPLGLSGPGHLKVWDLESRAFLLGPLTGHADRINCVAYSKDDTTIASGSIDGIVLWEAATGKREPAMLTVGHAVYSVCFSSDGHLLAAGDGDCAVQLWEGDHTTVVSLRGHNNCVRSVMFSPDDKRLVSGSDDFSVRIWSVETREVLHVLTGHTNVVWSVAFSPKGRHVVSGSGDRSVRIWNADTGKPVGVPLEGHTLDVRCVAFTPDGARVVSGGDDQHIRIWDRMPTIPLVDPNVTRGPMTDMPPPPPPFFPPPQEVTPALPTPALPTPPLPLDPTTVELPPSENGDDIQGPDSQAASAADTAPYPGPVVGSLGLQLQANTDGDQSLPSGASHDEEHELPADIGHVEPLGFGDSPPGQKPDSSVGQSLSSKSAAGDLAEPHIDDELAHPPEASGGSGPHGPECQTDGEREPTSGASTHSYGDSVDGESAIVASVDDVKVYS